MYTHFYVSIYVKAFPSRETLNWSERKTKEEKMENKWTRQEVKWDENKGSLSHCKREGKWEVPILE